MSGPATALPAPVLTRGALVAELVPVVGGARHEARFIVDEVLGAGAASSQESVPAGAATAARAMAARRAAGEPLQYVFGHWPFRGLDLVVDRRVLIPRPETEQVVDVALAELRRLSTPAPVAVDVGTGSGAIALALAAEAACGDVWAIDASVDALAVAALNLRAVRRRLGDGLRPVELVEGEWLRPLPARVKGGVQLVVSNPPYVSEDEWAALPAEVRCEPRQALVAGPSRDGTPGLAGVEAVLAQALEWLARPGVTVVELAPYQADAAADLARGLGYEEVRVEPDLVGRPRALVARAC